ncbi:hypothetical protein RB653_002501 [Dictyostelium firmibasis]|uniref:C2 NT-type domain-containing protein n=1 Tax=Dictyostelium firmibasis TaxID=79012 RepID=A0AAN7TXJ3_9MYCE
MDKFMKGKIKGIAQQRGEQGKFQFDFKIISVENLPVTGNCFVSWKRGTKSANNGKTKAVTINSNKSASFNHSFSMVTTLYKEKPPKKTYESKTIAISIKDEKNKKSIAKTMIDLADFTNFKDEQFKSIQIKQKKGGPIVIAMNIKTKEMEINPDDEPATETDLNSNDGSDDEDGEDFEQDEDSSVSSLNTNSKYSGNTNNITGKLDDDDILAPPSSNGGFKKMGAPLSSKSESFSSNSTTPTKTSTPSTPPSHSTASTTTVKPFSNDTEAELNALLSKPSSKPTITAAPVKSTPVSTLSSTSNSNPGKDKDWKREADDANHRVQQLERQVEVLQRDLKNNQNMASSGGNGGGVSQQEFADLKKRFREISGDNIDLEDKVKELEEKLANAYRQQPISAQQAGSSRQLTDLQEQVRQKDASIQELNIKNRRLERDLQDKDQEILDQTEQVKYYQEQAKSAQSAAQKAIAAAAASSTTSTSSEESQEEIAYLKREIQLLKDQQSPSVAVGGGTLELKRRIQDLTREVKEKDDALAKLKLGGSPTSAGGSLSSIAAQTSSNITITNLEKQNTELNKTLLTQQQDIDRSKQEIQQLQQQLNQAQKKINSVTNSPPPSVITTEELLKRENGDLKDKVATQHHEIKRIQEKYDQLNSRFNDEIEETNNVVNELRQREESLNRKVDELTQENQQMEHKLSNEMTSASALSMSAMSAPSKFSTTNRDKDRQERENAERQLELAKSELSREREKTKRFDRELKEYRERIRLLELQVEEGGGSVIKQENQDKVESKLIEQCIYTQPMTFVDGVGSVASSLYEQLTDICAFSQENAKLFTKVHNALQQALERAMYNSTDLAYWLSNISGLIHLIKDGPNNIDDDRDPIIDGVLIMQNNNSFSSTSQRKTPSQTFYYQLENLLRESYSLLLHSIYNKLRPKLTKIISFGTCILDKKTNRFSAAENDVDINKICTILQKYMNLLKDKFIFDSIVQQFFSQTFHFISYTLLNEVLNGENFCTPSSGFKIKLSLSKMDDWVSSSEERELLLPARDHFMSIIEAANLMVIDKSIFTDSDSVISAFETLNILQIKKLLEIWKPDNLSPDPIPKKIIASLNQQLDLNTHQRNLVVDPTILIDVQPKLS